MSELTPLEAAAMLSPSPNECELCKGKGQSLDVLFHGVAVDTLPCLLCGQFGKSAPSPNEDGGT